MDAVPPTNDENAKIATAWNCLEAVTRAMGDEQVMELLKVKTMCWQDIREWYPTAHALTFAEGRALERIRAGIEKKLSIGTDNDTFHFSRSPVDGDRGREAAYDFGQKLVRWNSMMEGKALNRLFNRKGPLQHEMFLPILAAAGTAHDSWWKRYGTLADDYHEELDHQDRTNEE
jgi:hypothetical protein